MPAKSLMLAFVAVLPGLSLSVPLQERQQLSKFYCRVQPNQASGTEWLNNIPLVADGGKFYLGGATSSSNPTNPTVFVGSPNACSLDVGVPGGQNVYVAPDLSIDYTSPHSANEPSGSVKCLDVDRNANPGSQTLNLWTTAFGTNGFMACPLKNGRWELFAQQWSGPLQHGASRGCVWIDLECQYYLDQSTPAANTY